jgi:hypothetical protein
MAILNGFNGYRERNRSPTLSSVFYFLGFDFALIASMSYYKAAKGGIQTQSQSGVELSFFPFPSAIYRF